MAWENDAMRALIGLLLIVYLVGVGVVLAPSLRADWSAAPAAALASSLAKDLPGALAWPEKAYRKLTST
jgi:hypothetical protein